jgi:hypothetical protein
VRPRGPVLGFENRERPAATNGLKSSPKPLSAALKCRERLRAFNRLVSGGIRLVNRSLAMAPTQTEVA